MNVKITEEALRESKRKRQSDEIAFYERLYKRGAGCFGVPKRDNDVKKHLDKLKKH
jgi:hypothetical protein